MTLFSGSILFKDAFNRKTRRQLSFEALDFLTAQAEMAAVVSAYAAMCEAGIVSSRVWEDTDVATVIVAGSNIDEGATFSWELNTLLSGKKAATKVPAPNKVIFDANGSMDLTNALVLAVETVFLNGIVQISEKETPVDLLSGKLDK